MTIVTKPRHFIIFVKNFQALIIYSLLRTEETRIEEINRDLRKKFVTSFHFNSKGWHHMSQKRKSELLRILFKAERLGAHK